MTNNLVFSGVQPTGNLHLGNYLGAIKQWVALQDQHDCLFCIVDYHAITVPQDPAELRAHTLDTAAAYIAAGIDPKRSPIFHQSSVNYHTELAWLFSCITPLGWLNRMTQFKEKAGKQKDRAALGLYSYPVLMAADILLYKATHVPVGDDQKQHLELAREIAGTFNDRYFGDSANGLLPLPEPLMMGAATRVMSLKDGTAKMSKSDPSELSRINLTDDADTIAKKVKKAKSDTIEGISYDKEARPEVSNLLTIFAAVTDSTVEAIAAEYVNSGFGAFKAALADACVAHLAPITEEIRRLRADEGYLLDILRSGAEAAGVRAEKNIKEIKDTIGFLTV